MNSYRCSRYFLIHKLKSWFRVIVELYSNNRTFGRDVMKPSSRSGGGTLNLIYHDGDSSEYGSIAVLDFPKGGLAGTYSLKALWLASTMSLSGTCCELEWFSVNFSPLILLTAVNACSKFAFQGHTECPQDSSVPVSLSPP